MVSDCPETVKRVKTGFNALLFRLQDSCESNKGQIRAYPLSCFRTGSEVLMYSFALKQVIHALKNPGIHIPYRESTLTSVLRKSLGNQCRVVFVLTLSAEADDLGETVATCR